MWRFPEIGIPPNHPFVDGTPIYGKPIPSLQDEPRSYQAVFASLGNNWSWPGNRKWQVDNAPFSFIIFPYVYIYIYTYIYTCTHTHNHTHMYTYVYICIYIDAHILRISHVWLPVQRVGPRSQSLLVLAKVRVKPKMNGSNERGYRGRFSHIPVLIAIFMFSHCIHSIFNLSYPH